MTVIFSRGLGLVYFCAFASLLPQILGLYGSAGIFPVEQMLKHLPETVPTLFRFRPTDGMLIGTCWTGLILSVFLILHTFPRIVSFLLWALFLSLVNIGAVFLQYQWDALLLEVGFLAIFLNTEKPSRWIIFLYRLLIFRLLFMSGLSKLLSGDPSWKDFSATAFHFESQPLPTALGWLWHQMPLGFHRFSCGVMFFLELVMPFLIFCGPRARKILFFSSVALQVGFLMTGNYGYFNYLTIVLSLMLLPSGRVKTKPPHFFAKAAWGLLFVLSLSRMWLFSPLPFIDSLHQKLADLHLTSPYGLFAVMTKGRNELVIEGSLDRLIWKEYQTRYNPNDPKKMPGWIAPHQPRLDWQLWFAALGDFQNEKWLRHLLVRLFEGSEKVAGLFKNNPFPSHPPRYLRIRSQKYSFSTWEEFKNDGIWWKTGEPTIYSGEMELEVD